MNNPVWLIEAGVYGNEATPLLAEIRRQGMIAELITHQALKRGSVLRVGDQILGDGSYVIGYGTFPFARQIQLHQKWTPGAWCNAEKLDCRCYVEHFKRFLLNQRFRILPGVDAIRDQQELFAEFGSDDEVFVRPTACDKLFVGRRMSREHFRIGLALTRYDPTTQILVAPPQEIEREWRLVVIGDRVISGSQYALNGQRNITADCPEEVRVFAEKMLAEVAWRPDPIFMLDICESDGQLWLVELNSFSTSWLYHTDLAAVVASASELASRL